MASLLSVSVWAQQKAPIVLGHKDAVQSKLLGETRTVNVYLPPDYNEQDTARYPVIYLLDGGVDEDFIHIVGLVQFNNFSWINRVPKSIIIGIENVNRLRDYSFPSTVQEEREKYPASGGSARFIEFIEKELIPEVEKHYRTAEGRMLIGQSLGGLLAAEILLKRPALFDRYMIVSPSLWWSDGVLLQERTEALASLGRKTDVYIAVGKEGLTPSKNPRVMEVDANLLVDKIGSLGKQVQVWFDYLPEEDHATIMHQAAFNGFRKLYPVQ